MNRYLALLLFACCTVGAQAPAPQKRIRALVISGGCCHDYVGQDKILMEKVSRELPVDWTVLYEGGTGSNVQVALYNQPDWAKGYDIVVHNECYANVGDEAFIRKITAAHKGGVPAMVVHCSMHSYRSAMVDDWREFLGVTTRRHTRAHNVAVKVVAKDNYIMQGMKEEWSTPTDELYVIEKSWPNITPLATAVSPEQGTPVYPVAWINDYNGTRVFGTTLGHGETWNEPQFVTMIVRGFKWTVKRE